VKEILDEEYGFTENFLSEKSVVRLIEGLEEVLVTNHCNTILSKGLSGMVKNLRYDALKLLYLILAETKQVPELK
jgi:hypothetical protein